MTIKEQVKSGTGIEAGKVLCASSDGHKNDKTLELIHNGYGGNPPPLSKEQLTQLNNAAQKHEKETKGKHNIIIWMFHK